jgi:acyl-CoA synthetase (AMP-forming)/AMP-acid ligase II
VAGPLEEYAEIEPGDGLIGHGWGTNILIADLEDIMEAGPSPIAEPLTKSDSGYIWIRTPSIMQGYFNRPEETSQVLKGGWFFTGDLGYLDDQGRLILTGRSSNQVNKGGIKISLEELDLIIERHPKISEACTFRIQDHILGENIGVCVVINEVGSGFSLSEITHWCGVHMSDYKIPVTCYVVTTIPKTSRGKINRDNVATFCASLKALS